MLAQFLLLAFAAPSVLALPISETRQSCGTGVHIIVARASTEQAGEGIMGDVASSVIKSVPGSDSVAVNYPATLQDYDSSEAQGVTAMTSLIEQYVAACPKGRIVLMGYSQGAQVVADTLIGKTGSSGGLPSKYRKNIVAVVQMGDPSHVAGQSFDKGTSSTNGMYARSNSANYKNDGYAAIMQSYCDSGDPYCASGNDLMVHLGYYIKYGTAAEQFVTSLVK